jgi:hypothetical protein
MSNLIYPQQWLSNTGSCCWKRLQELFRKDYKNLGSTTAKAVRHQLLLMEPQATVGFVEDVAWDRTFSKYFYFPSQPLFQ